MASLLTTPLAGIATQTRDSSTTPSICSVANQLVCGGTNPPRDLCNAITACCAGSSTSTTTGPLTPSQQLISTQCTNALMKVDRNDLESIANSIDQVAPAAVEAFCAATRQNVNLINQSTDLADNVTKLYTWYFNDVSPAIVATCGKTKSPISDAEMTASTKRIQTAFCGQTDILNYPKAQLFVLKYFKPIIGIVVGTFVLMLILTLVLGINLRNARAQLSRTQLSCAKVQALIP